MWQLHQSVNHHVISASFVFLRSLVLEAVHVPQIVTKEFFLKKKPHTWAGPLHPLACPVSTVSASRCHRMPLEETPQIGPAVRLCGAWHHRPRLVNFFVVVSYHCVPVIDASVRQPSPMDPSCPSILQVKKTQHFGLLRICPEWKKASCEARPGIHFTMGLMDRWASQVGRTSRPKPVREREKTAEQHGRYHTFTLLPPRRLLGLSQQRASRTPRAAHRFPTRTLHGFPVQWSLASTSVAKY